MWAVYPVYRVYLVCLSRVIGVGVSGRTLAYSPAADPGSAEGRLLDACLQLGMGDHTNAIAIASAPLPQGGMLGESVGGKNLRIPSVFWADIDLTHSHFGTEAALAKHSVRLPILTSGINGASSNDERLDGIKMARAMVLASYAGATGATFSETSADGALSLLRADGTPTPGGRAIRELSRELAGATPVTRAWDDQGIPGALGDDIVALPFVRERETILVLWNNSFARRSITLTLNSPPISQHIVTISRNDPFVERQYNPHFTFSKKAMDARSQDDYITLDPLQIKVMRYRMSVALPTWLDALTFTPREHEGAPKHGRDVDDRTWWQKLQDWADGNE